jgi:hypothetical protein
MSSNQPTTRNDVTEIVAFAIATERGCGLEWRSHRVGILIGDRVFHDTRTEKTIGEPSPSGRST